MKAFQHACFAGLSARSGFASARQHGASRLVSKSSRSVAMSVESGQQLFVRCLARPEREKLKC
jgi:hypothetical protein